MLREILQRIVGSCGSPAGAALVGFDGSAVEMVERGDGADLRALGQEFSFVLTQMRKAAEILEVGALEEVTIRSERFLFLVRILGEEHFLCLAIDPAANAGKCRFAMRMAHAELAAHL